MARRAGLPWVVGSKERLGDRRVRVKLSELPAAGRAILVDDIASTGATLAATARELRRHGIERVEAVVVHAIFSPGAMRRIRSAGIERVASCDTIPHASNAIDTAAYFARFMGNRTHIPRR